ncbi:hypothetical protein DSECCO2_650550 [anaerobic digester metagenome]
MGTHLRGGGDPLPAPLEDLRVGAFDRALRDRDRGGDKPPQSQTAYHAPFLPEHRTPRQPLAPNGAHAPGPEPFGFLQLRNRSLRISPAPFAPDGAHAPAPKTLRVFSSSGPSDHRTLRPVAFRWNVAPFGPSHSPNGDSLHGPPDGMIREMGGAPTRSLGLVFPLDCAPDGARTPPARGARVTYRHALLREAGLPGCGRCRNFLGFSQRVSTWRIWAGKNRCSSAIFG